MKIYLGSDHAGFERKQEILKALTAQGIECIDEGTHSLDSVDYPDYANLVCRHFKENHSHLPFPPAFGILICGSGQGMAMRANKFPWIRAALCWSVETAKLSREHNDANVLCMGSRVIDQKLSLEVLNAFIKTSFAGGRHEARVVKVGSPT